MLILKFNTKKNKIQLTFKQNNRSIRHLVPFVPMYHTVIDYILNNY